MIPTLMIQGTTSDAGKTTLVAGLCRVLARRGVKVAPFKPQNMALNSAVTQDGGEIGRAQALQAEACFLDAHSDMNPVLLKPSSDMGSQVIIQGKAVCHLDAQAYHDYKQVAKKAVLESYQRLQDQYEIILVEGAGSPAEINLRDNDIANMGFAESVDCPVVLMADIDRGGVFAHLIGTLELLSPSEQDRVIGFVINKFRGDISLLQSGLDWLEQRTGKPVLGVLPYLHGLHLDAEDAINSEQTLDKDAALLKVIVPVFPRISNHTDFDPLRLHPQVDLQFIGPHQPVPDADLIILPGSKNVRQDLQWLRDNKWEQAIHRHLRYKGKLLGICGGFQMLGNEIADPSGIEHHPGTSKGLELLDIKTELQEQKQLSRVSGHLFTDGRAGDTIEGYEIHCGSTSGPGLKKPALFLLDSDKIKSRPEGAISADGQIMGTYIHGLFDHTQGCVALLQWAGLKTPASISHMDRREQDINRLADCIEQHLTLNMILPDTILPFMKSRE